MKKENFWLQSGDLHVVIGDIKQVLFYIILLLLFSLKYLNLKCIQAYAYNVQ